VEITQERFGPLHLAMGRPLNSKERWIVISDEPTSLETFREYGLRFDIEENFLDDKSNGFQLEASLIRSAPALERLCLVLAVATLYLGSVKERTSSRPDNDDASMPIGFVAAVISRSDGTGSDAP